MSTLNNSTQSVPYGSGHVYATLIRKADGTAVEPPQALHIEGLQEATWDDKNTLKESHGEGRYAVRVAGGKSSLTFNLTVNEISGQLLNALCYGKDVEQRQLKINTDRNGFVVPTESLSKTKIINKKLVNLARIDSNTSVTISGSAATLSSLPDLLTGTYEYTAPGKYRFSPDDAGKIAVITYDSNGTALEATLKIPTSLSWNATLHSQHKSLTRGVGTGTKLKKLGWSNTASAPDVDKYRASLGGQVVFNNAQTGVMKINHITDGQAVTTKVTTLPDAAYSAYVDTGSAAPWVGDVAVELTTDSGTAMTGVTPGTLLMLTATTPTTGQYVVDTGGLYTFAAGDVNDVVTIHYTADFQVVAMTPPDDGAYVRDLGVRTLGGIGLTRVALTAPLSLAHNQYAVDDGGTYYLDDTNGGDNLRINYQYELADVGQTITVTNDKIGEAPTLMLDIAYELDGEMMTVSFERVKPIGAGVPTKQEDFAGMKFEMRGFANRQTGVVYTISTSA